MEKDLKKQVEVVCQGTEDILIKDELVKMLETSIKENKPLKVKLGLDPTSPDIHLGHMVVLNKLRQFQDLGHKAVLIIGDYTARIGDPSGRSTLRPKLDAEVIDKNAETYMNQAFKILDSEKTEVVKNSEWLKPLQLADILSLTSRFTVARMLERDDFKKRFNGNISIAIMEFLYPIMQAYDSVAINSDIELGGTDQRFNLLVGRELQKDLGQRQQIAITMPILVGLDGVNKMSKSLGNYIGVTEKPNEIFGKVMSIPDNIMIGYYRLLTRLSKDEIDSIEKQVTVDGENPVFAKRNLAKIIIQTLYNKKHAAEAEEHFDVIFKEKKAPDEIAEFCLSSQDIIEGRISAVNLLVKSGLAESNTAAKNLILQGAIKAADVKITDIGFSFDAANLNGVVIQKGKRFFRKIKV